MNKKEIKVYLQYPWFFPDSPYYKYLIDNPPKGILYKNVSNQMGVITNKKKFLFSNNLKKGIRKTINFFNLSFPNTHLTSKEDYNLIHCAHCLSKNKDKTWVMDIEAEWQFYIGNKNKFSKERVKKYLLNENCKKILPWTKSTADEIIKEFPEIKDKIEVVYPAIPVPEIKKKKEKEKITILYATRYFWIKGGYIALEVFRRLKKEYKDDINLIFISDVPFHLKEEYSNLKILDLISQEKMKDYYQNADIFFYPSFMDTFGFGLLEAMSYGLPIVSVNTQYTKSRKEIIKNNKTGLVLDIPKELTLKWINQKENLSLGYQEEEIISKLLDNLKLLIENKNLLQKMSENCLEEIKNGKFSIKERNKKLRKIYEEAIR